MMRLLAGHVLDVLATLPDESVHCVVTSPPYWGLRDYGIEPVVWGGEADCAHEWGDEPRLSIDNSDKRRWNHAVNGRGEEQPDHKKIDRQSGEVSQGMFCRHCTAWRGSLGLEPSIDLYVEHMVAVFREVRRVLRKDGTCWLNLGDCYAQGHGGSTTAGNYVPKTANRGAHKAGAREGIDAASWSTRDASLRNIVPGLKPKDLCMIPARVALALQADGWWLRSEIVWAKPNPMPESVTDRPTSAHEKLFLLSKSARYFYDAEAVRDAGKDWSNGGPGTGIKATTHYHPDNGGNEGLSSLASRYKTGEQQPGRNLRNVWTIATAPFPEAHFATFPPALVEPCIKAGCPEDGTVLDPFGGAGTTGLVADRLQRDAILIEINPDYAEMARDRVTRDAPLFFEVDRP